MDKVNNILHGQFIKTSMCTLRNCMGQDIPLAYDVGLVMTLIWLGILFVTLVWLGVLSVGLA